jgi:hypothetical protein
MKRLELRLCVIEVKEGGDRMEKQKRGLEGNRIERA